MARRGDGAPETALAGRLILLVEDDALVALELVQVLEEQGARVVGPATSVQRALELIDLTPRLDGAVLDINLHGELSFPVADCLHDRGIPFVFETGYDERALPERHLGAPRFAKPADLHDLARALASGLEGSPR